ncbi:MAG: family 20 glycosylhydrolase [Ilumatobacteraceae bacterium]
MLVPLPRTLEWGEGWFEFDATTAVAADPELVSLASRWCDELGALLAAPPTRAAQGRVELRLHAHRSDLGDEGYELFVEFDGIGIVAATPHGAWNATRTVRQLLDGSRVRAAHVVDTPRFEWRGAMLDVARHFFGVDDVCRFIELISRFKLNRLHLHLTDDQGWRLEIPGRPALTDVGGATACLSDDGGWFTAADWARINAHAAAHFVTVVPEIDLPGHTRAALVSVPELNPDGVAPEPYTGMEVGHSSLRIDLPATEPFLVDVIAAVAAMTPGPYVHIGGDEAHSTERAEYVAFIELLQREVGRHGKRMVGWEEITSAELHPHTLVQFWLRAETAAAAPAGCRFVMSPSSHTYLDMKHRDGDPLGRRWAGMIDIDAVYGWDPAMLIDGVDDSRIAGVEAPLWTEKVRTFAAVQTLCFPRLVCLAEVGWTPQHERSWETFEPRLAVVTAALEADGVPVYRPSEKRTPSADS